MTRPFPARYLLLAQAAALAAMAVLAMVIAASRDQDARPATGAGAGAIGELREAPVGSAPAEYLRAAPVTTSE